MITTERVMTSKGRSAEYKLFGLGDVHIGALNCAEKEFRTVVQKIKKDPNALWFGGGDYCDAVILNDVKRFDVNVLPNWMLTGGAKKVKRNLKDMVKAQQDRFLEMVDPIRDKCLGLIEGNHEYSIFKYHNRDHLTKLCESLDVPNLSDCTFMRLKFKRENSSGGINSIIVFACHGHGGGRTSGAEPNGLFRLAADKDADIVMRGHSHTFHILPPLTMLGIPKQGKLVEDATTKLKHVANWGAYMYTYQSGPSTYASRATYPVRPMFTVETIIKPFRRLKNSDHECVDVTMREVKL